MVLPDGYLLYSGYLVATFGASSLNLVFSIVYFILNPASPKLYIQYTLMVAIFFSVVKPDLVV
jgi:hypothetical protein